MSAQYGKCNFDGKTVDPKELNPVRPLLFPYGPDGEGTFCKENVGVLYRAFYTTKKFPVEVQPYQTPSGCVITWDGRLDNRERLVRQLANDVSVDLPDVSIVAAGYEKWGTEMFAKLLGDWALAIWDSNDCSVMLAVDFIGARRLYYLAEKHCVTWCTILDPIVLLADRSFKLEREYLAGWLSFFPAPHLTAYADVLAVPPSSFVRFRKDGRQIIKYWEFNPAKTIRYRSDAEYEEHFRAVFAESLRRRLRSPCPILAELSGGVDSASVVCMADEILGRGLGETPTLDTVSYYDDRETNWNERPYFTRVEEKRGRMGCHIDVGAYTFSSFGGEFQCYPATPCSGRPISKAGEEFAACLTSRGSRVLLSGIGGDEVAGGVPTPAPELADLVATAQVLALAHQLFVWALETKRPWFHLLTESLRDFFPSWLVGIPEYLRPAPWLERSFTREYRAALSGYYTRLRLFGSRPSFQQNVSTLEALRRQLGCEALSRDPIYEKRYPYLDRDLLEFMYAVPRGQLVRPGQRRSLQRRALAGIVPDEILNRRSKAYVTRTPRASISSDWVARLNESGGMVAHLWGIVDSEKFAKSIQEIPRNHDSPIVFLFRTLAAENWLRELRRRGIFMDAAEVKLSHGGRRSVSAEAIYQKGGEQNALQ